jgi:hypothetical protein
MPPRPVDRVGKKRNRNRSRPALKKFGDQDLAEATRNALDFYRSFLLANDPLGISPPETWGEPAVERALEQCDTEVTLAADKAMLRLVSTIVLSYEGF